jgi:hypothetical protein
MASLVSGTLNPIPTRVPWSRGSTAAATRVGAGLGASGGVTSLRIDVEPGGSDGRAVRGSGAPLRGPVAARRALGKARR